MKTDYETMNQTANALADPTAGGFANMLADTLRAAYASGEKLAHMLLRLRAIADSKHANRIRKNFPDLYTLDDLGREERVEAVLTVFLDTVNEQRVRQGLEPLEA